MWSHNKAWNHGMWNSIMRMADHQVHHWRFFGSANLNTQLHNIISHSAITPKTISHFTVPLIGSYQMLINAKIGRKDHHWQMAARADTNQGCRHAAYDMAKSIQISRVASANMTHLTKILVVNHKQLSNNIIDPLFLWYLWVSSQCQGGARVPKVSKFEC